MPGYDAELLVLVESGGPRLSSKLVEALVARGSAPEAARQRISRAIRSGALLRTKGIEFPHRESFVYHKEQTGGPLFVQNLWEALAESQSLVAHCLQSMHARGGMVPDGHFAGVCGAADRLKKQLPPARVREFVLQYGLVEQRIIEELGECLQLGRGMPLECSSTPNRLKSRLLAEGITLDHLQKWLSVMGFISWGSAELRTHFTQPEFGQFHWDLTTPSYIHPFIGTKKGGDLNPGFVVADVIINGQLTLPHVRSFLRKCNVIRHQQNPRPFMSMIVADHFTHEAFTEIRKHGCMAITIETLLGSDLSKALKTLIAVLTNTAQAAAATPEVIHEVFGKLSAIEGAAGNLRGPLFELIVAHCVAQADGGSVDLQKTIRDNESQVLTDIDVLRTKQNQEVTAYECKGHLGNVRVDVPEIERWIKNTIPKTRKWFLQQAQFRDVKHRFEFWTTGILTEGASSYLEQAKDSIHKYEIDWRDSAKVMEYVGSVRAGKLVDVLRENYFNHPLPAIEVKNTRKSRREQASPLIQIPESLAEECAETAVAT